MLRIWFGDNEKAIYNTSVYFKNVYKDEWITEKWAKDMIYDIDQSEVLDAHNIKSPVLGGITPEKLSAGAKTLLLMRHFPGKIFNASNCGDNCSKWILEMAQSKNFTINLYHIMNFGKEPFEIRILNDKKLRVYNMSELLDAGVKYLQEEQK